MFMIAYSNHLLNGFPGSFIVLAINKAWPGDWDYEFRVKGNPAKDSSEVSNDQAQRVKQLKSKISS